VPRPPPSRPAETEQHVRVVQTIKRMKQIRLAGKKIVVASCR
jgi:hypothetical protein